MPLKVNCETDFSFYSKVEESSLLNYSIDSRRGNSPTPTFLKDITAMGKKSLF